MYDNNKQIINITWHHPHTGQRRSLMTALPVTIGRAADNTIPLDSKFVSAHHVRLEERQGELFIVDLGSRNSVRVNNHDDNSSITMILNGDQLQVGPFTFSIELTDSSAALGDAKPNCYKQPRFSGSQK